MTSLKIEQKQSKLNNIKLAEKIDIATLDKLIQSDLLQVVPWINPQTGQKVCYDNEKAHLLAIRKKVKNGLLHVNYSESKIGFGRVYPQRSLSLCSIRRELRHTLAKTSYVDIDVDNCHPVILKQICEKNNLDCKYLSKYCKDRKKYLQQVIETYETTRDIAKNLFIRLAYFGSFDAWKDEFEIKSNKKLKFIENYTMELKCIGLEIVNNNPKLLKSIQKLNKNNETASLVSTLLQEHEKRILECCFNYLRLQNIILDNAVLCFDVIMIPTDKYNIKLLLELSKVVKDELDFDVNFSQKDMNNDYLQEIKDIVDTDGFAFKSEQFELNHCKIVNKSLYLKHSDNDIIVFSSKKLNESYCDLVYGAEENSFISKWVNKNPRIRKYDDMNIYPHPLKCPTNEFNLWTPFEMSKYKDNYENNETGLNFLLNHIKISPAISRRGSCF